MNSTQKPHPVDVACSEMACSCGREHTFTPLSDTTTHGQDIGQAQEWTTERMKGLGICHNGQADSIVDGASMVCALWPTADINGKSCGECVYFGDAPVRIEPPKGGTR